MSDGISSFQKMGRAGSRKRTLLEQVKTYAIRSTDYSGTTIEQLHDLHRLKQYTEDAIGAVHDYQDACREYDAEHPRPKR